MSIDEKALAHAQDCFANELGEYRDMSIRNVIEAYEAAKETHQPVDRDSPAYKAAAKAFTESQGNAEGKFLAGLEAYEAAKETHQPDELPITTRGGGLQSRAKQIIRNAETRQEMIDEVARLLCEIDNLRATKRESSGDDVRAGYDMGFQAGVASVQKESK